jgi:hypothetical protein
MSTVKHSGRTLVFTFAVQWKRVFPATYRFTKAHLHSILLPFPCTVVKQIVETAQLAARGNHNKILLDNSFPLLVYGGSSD